MDGKFKVTVHTMDDGKLSVSIDTSGHVSMSTSDYSPALGNYYSVCFYQTTIQDIDSLVYRLLDAKHRLLNQAK